MTQPTPARFAARRRHQRRALWLVPALALLGMGAGGREPSLVDAVKSGDVRTVRELVRRRVDVNAPMVDGTTALHWAVNQDALEVVNLLLQAGANVSATNRYGVMPLSLAATNGNAPMIERLLKAGANPNSALPGGETVLMTASRTGTVEAVRLLLAAGANPNAQELTRGQTALMWAAAEGNAGVIPVLIEAGAQVNARSDSPVLVRAEKKPVALISRDDGQPASGGDASASRGMGGSRIDRLTPLLFAARRGHGDAVKALLAGGADIKATAPDGSSAVSLAIGNAQFATALLLLDRGGSPTAATSGWTALHQLVRVRRPSTGHLAGPAGFDDPLGLDVARALVARGADVNARMTIDVNDGYRHRGDRVGATPYWLAAKGVDAEMMALLVSLGADPAIPTNEKTTPLMAAAGVGIRSPGEDSGTDSDALAAVKMCLDLGANVNDENVEGWTALQGAAYRGATPVIQILIDKGAKLDHKNKRGWSALRIAEGIFYDNFLYRQPHIAALLREMLAARGLPIEVISGDIPLLPDS